MPKCLVVQHLEPEGPYQIAAVLDRNQVEVELCRVFDGDVVPVDVSGYDSLVVMGGTMCAASDDGFPTRRAELALLHDALAHSVPVLGVCLGAQLLAAAAGGRVYPGTNGLEMGWLAIEPTASAKTDRLFFGLGSSVTVLHWHSDTFDLPPGSVHLARSERYAHQAFRVGETAWGLQFHLEVDDDAVTAFAEAFGHDPGVPAATPQMLEGPARAALARLAPTRTLVLERFAALVRERSVNSGNKSCL
jgi:GMP synthase-like glutamine amidotransferase